MIFETDSTTVCHAMESPTDALGSISTVVLGLCSRLHKFRTFQASHLGQQGNKLAHTLAALTRNINSFVTWMTGVHLSSHPLFLRMLCYFLLFNY